MERRETEFKLLLSGAQDVVALRAVLPAGPTTAASTHDQRNHFFDTPAGALRGALCALRLRSEDGAWTITAKGPARDAGADEADEALAQRAEEECEVAEAGARAILAGESSPLEVLVERTPSSALLTHLRALSADQPFVHIGSFDNQRTRVGPVLLDFGDTQREVVFEFDRTQFSETRVDWEVEVEVPSAEGPAVGQVLRELFQLANLAWQPAPTKAARFFAEPTS